MGVPVNRNGMPGLPTLSHLEDIQTGKVALEIYECACGFHLGLDATYLGQVGAVEMACPGCKKMFAIKPFEP